MAALSTGAATVSSLAQLLAWETEKQRQCRHDDVRQRKCQKRAAICDAYVDTESLTDWEWLPGELLSGLKCSKSWPDFR